jgi:hypothetical protein
VLVDTARERQSEVIMIARVSFEYKDRSGPRCGTRGTRISSPSEVEIATWEEPSSRLAHAKLETISLL